jgi:ubiquinone/menaquinone biosynthesis C-methylase UbiE
MQRVKSEYDSVAETYERLVAPRFGVVAAHLVAVAAVRPGERVLEIGAGTGTLSRMAAPRLEPGGELVLLDVSQEMLKVAARVLHAQGCRNASFVTRDMDDLPFAGGDFDAVLSHMSYFEESQQAAHQAFRVLRPGGRIAMAVWGPLTRHGELRLTRPARRAAGLTGPWVPTIGEASRRLVRAGFAGVKSEEGQFENLFESVDAYLAYRQAFPTSVLSPDARSRYFATLRREAEGRAGPDGSLLVDWTATFIAALKP